MPKPLLFVHIPKTGGNSIYNALNLQIKWNVPEMPLTFKKHQPLFVIEKYNDLSKYSSFSVVRNPFKRAFSYYKHYGRITNEAISFESFLNKVKQKSKPLSEMISVDHIPYNNDKTPFIGFTQSFFIFDSSGKIAVDKIYRTENLQEFESDYNVKVSKHNSGNYSTEDYYSAYTPEIISLVKDIYLEDFENLGYSKDFS